MPFPVARSVLIVLGITLLGPASFAQIPPGQGTQKPAAKNAQELAPVAPGPKLTLQQAFEAALGHSETIQIQKVTEDQSDNTLTQMRSRLAPTIGGLASVTRQGRSTGGDDITTTDSTLTRVGITQPLYKGGILSTGIDIAKLNQQRARLGTAEASRQLWWAVTQVYYGILAAEQDLKNLQEQDDVLGRRQNEIGRRVRLGRSRNANLQSTLSQRATLSANIENLRSQVAVAKMTLAQVMGVESVGALAVPERPMAQKEVKLNERTDIRLQELNVEGAKLGVELVKSNLFPELNLTANYYPYRNDTVSTFSNATKWDAGLVLTWTLDWEEINQSQKRDKLYVQNMEELKQKQIERLSREELIRKDELSKGIDNRSRELVKAVDASEKALKATQSDFNSGTSDFLDLFTAEDSYWALKRQSDTLNFQKDLLAWEVLWLKGQAPSSPQSNQAASNSQSEVK